ncbi:hypothetical protein B296_00030226 [Ensete ventricosum]|uniref:Uncharacterized protein n=1 Tax=Ensete ventricosum TaxID=4639 RepID=A0A426Z219_ENSVE|nr:hypothetical protein B296_00030226 [Ensete ventricosum]
MCGCYDRKGGKEDYNSDNNGWKSHRKQRRLVERAAAMASSWQRRQAVGRRCRRRMTTTSMMGAGGRRQQPTGYDRGSVGGDSGKEEGNVGGEREIVAGGRSRGRRRAWLQQREEKAVGFGEGCGSERAAGSDKGCGGGRQHRGVRQRSTRLGAMGATGASSERRKGEQGSGLVVVRIAMTDGRRQ